jgi:alpha-glucosidase
VPTGPKRPRADVRDGARTPMQWDDGLNAGFSKGTPWLPVESTYKKYNVVREERDADSVYAWYAKLLQLRHQNAALREGAYVPLESGNRDVFVFGRKASDGELVLVALNMSPKEQAVHITGMAGAWPIFRTVLMASPAANAPEADRFTIAPYGVLVSATK